MSSAVNGDDGGKLIVVVDVVRASVVAKTARRISTSDILDGDTTSIVVDDALLVVAAGVAETITNTVEGVGIEGSCRADGAPEVAVGRIDFKNLDSVSTCGRRIRVR